MEDKKNKRYKDILFKIYGALYKEAEPSADFLQLLEEAPWCSRENGTFVPHPEAKDMTREECLANHWMKKIPYEKYFLDGEKYEKIVNKILKRHKLTDSERQILTVEAYLGCGPTVKNLNKEVKEDDGQ